MVPRLANLAGQVAEVTEHRTGSHSGIDPEKVVERKDAFPGPSRVTMPVHLVLSSAKERFSGGEPGLKQSISGQFGLFECRKANKGETEDGPEGASPCAKPNVFGRMNFQLSIHV